VTEVSASEGLAAARWAEAPVPAAWAEERREVETGRTSCWFGIAVASGSTGFRSPAQKIAKSRSAKERFHRRTDRDAARVQYSERGSLGFDRAKRRSAQEIAKIAETRSAQGRFPSLDRYSCSPGSIPERSSLGFGRAKDLLHRRSQRSRRPSRQSRHGGLPSLGR